MTESKKSKQNRNDLKRDAEKILNISIDDSEHVIAIFDNELNYLFANKATCKLLSKKLDDLEGNNLLHIFPQLTASISHRNLLTALSGKTLMDATSEGNITKEGAKFLSNYYPLKKNGSIYAVLVITKKTYFP